MYKQNVIYYTLAILKFLFFYRFSFSNKSELSAPYASVTFSYNFSMIMITNNIYDNGIILKYFCKRTFQNSLHAKIFFCFFPKKRNIILGRGKPSLLCVNIIISIQIIVYALRVYKYLSLSLMFLYFSFFSDQRSELQSCVEGRRRILCTQIMTGSHIIIYIYRYIIYPFILFFSKALQTSTL